MSNTEMAMVPAANLLMQWLQSRPVPIPYAEAKQFCGMFQYKPIAAGQHVFMAGRRINYVYFVAVGCLRLYIQHHDGTEQTLGLYEENEFVTEPYSFIEEQPTTLSLQATEDSMLLAINRTHWNTACKEFDWYAPLHQQNIKDQLQGLYQFLSALKATGAAQSYLYLKQTRANLLKRLPDHLIAAYLGITPDELSALKAALGLPA